MKNSKIYILISFFFLLISIGTLIFLFKSQPKLGFIYNTKVISGYDGIKDSKKIYLKKETAFNSNIDTLESELVKTIKIYQHEYKSMSEKERQLTEHIISKKQNDLARYKDAVDKEIKEAEIHLTADVMRQINEYVVKFGKDNGYDYIFGTTENGSLFFAREGDDLTNKIIEGLNKEYKGLK